MDFEVTLLRITRERGNYERYARIVKPNTMDARTTAFLSLQGKYFEQNPGAQVIEAEAFYTFYRLMFPNAAEDTLPQAKALIETICKPLDSDLARGISNKIIANNYAADILALMEKYNEGGEVDLHMQMAALMQAFEHDLDRKGELPEVKDEIEDMLKDDDNHVGYQWRIPELNQSMRPLIPGDFIILAARPDKGKTSWLTDQTSYMTQFVPLVHPTQPDRPFVWLNNEGPGKRIKKRYVQSALGLTVSEMQEMAHLPSKSGNFRSLLMEEFYAVTHGGFNRLRVYDVHDYWNHELEEIFKQMNPALVIYDMLDVVKFMGMGSNNGQRTDQLLEAMYQWGRMMCVKYDHVAIATSQISADGDGLEYPTLPMLKDSKTGKQGASDAIITLGASNNPALEGYRYIGATKNKMNKEGGRRDPRVAVTFDALRGRFSSAGMQLQEDGNGPAIQQESTQQE